MPSRRRTLSIIGTLTVTGLAGCAGTLDGDSGGPGDANSSNEREESNDETAPEESDATDDGDGADSDRGDENEVETDGEDEGENDDDTENGTGDENTDNDDTTPDETFLTVSSGDRETDAVRYEQVESASEPATIDGQHVLPVVLTDGGADSFRDALEETGAMESPRDAEVTAYQGGEAVHSRRLSEELIATAEASDFVGPFNVPLESREQADEIYEAIETDEK